MILELISGKTFNVKFEHLSRSPFMFTESFSPRFLTILEARNLRSRCRQHCFLLKHFFLFYRWLPSVSSLDIGIKAHSNDLILGFLGGSDSKESFYSAGDPGSIHGWGRSPGEGHGKPLQYSCLENPMDRRTWWATVHEVSESGMIE